MPIEVPSDFFTGVAKKLDKEKKDLDKQIDHARQEKNTDLVKQLENKKLKIEKTEKNLRQSSVMVLCAEIPSPCAPCR